MHPTRRPAPGWRRRATPALALVCLLPLLVVSAGVAGGQEPEREEDAPASSTTTTEPSPTTVVLDDGDIGVVPPGAEDPGDDGTEPSPPPEPPPENGDTPVPDELPVVQLPDPTPGLNAALAALDVTAAERAVGRTRAALLETTRHARVAARQRAAAVRARRSANREAVEAQSLVHALAVNAVMFGDIAGLEPVLGVPSLAGLRDRELADVTAEHLRERLDRARRDLRDAHILESAATAEVVRTRAQRHRAELAHVTARTDLDRALRQARGARGRLGPTILGAAVLETADLVAWYRTYYRSDPPMAPIETIIDTYLTVGDEEGVTGDIAFAQAVLETGGFRTRHARGFNFAGIGAFDSCAPTCGLRFPDLDAGVRAHVHLLRAYADPGLTAAQLAVAPDRRVAPERVGVRGCCPRWTALTGVWASDPNYHRKVLGIYRLMVETARRLDRQQT